jgi:hypothetical protein
MSKLKDWGVHYSTAVYLKQMLQKHEGVLTFRQSDDIYFEIIRASERPQVNALLINVYRVGLADVHKAIHEFPNLNCIVIGGGWNQYTDEAKEYATECKIGLFNFSEFLGSLYLKLPYLYVKKDDDGKSNRKAKPA